MFYIFISLATMFFTVLGIERVQYYMKMLENLKIIYSGSKEKIIVTDSDFHPIWKNSDDVPTNISLLDFKYDNDERPILPIEKEIILSHLSGCAVKILPQYHDDSLDGYILFFYSPIDIETLSCRSDRLFYKNNFLGNIRLELAEVIGALDNLKIKYADNNDFAAFDHKARYHILRTFSSSVNMNEITKYFSGNIPTEYVNFSKRIEETLAWVRPMFESNMCKIKEQIQHGVFLDINYNRVETALLNLLVNGYMYNDSPRKIITVTLSQNEDNVILKVFDNGTNADIENIEKYRDLYTQFSQFSRNESMGIALTDEMVKYFGGEMHLSNTEKGGLCVTLKFKSNPDYVPKVFKLRRLPPIISQFDSQNCILSKGFDPIK